MNGKIEKEKSQTMGLLIINAIIWIPLLIIIILIIGVSKVYASNRVRIFDMSNNQCANVNGNTANCNNLSKRALITLTFNQTIQSGSRINATFNYTYSQRTLYVTRTLWEDLDIYKVYQVDSQGETTDITQYCNLGKSTSVSRTGTGIQDTELRQYFVQGTCDYIATVDTISILLEPRNIYQNNTSPGSGSTTVLISDFNATSNPDGTEEIINNATNNTINIINNAQNNTSQIMENANANADKIGQKIEEQFNTCQTYNLDNNILNEDGKLISNGNVDLQTGWFHTSEYIQVNQNKNYTLTRTYTGGGGTLYCLYDKKKDIISCVNAVSGQREYTINTGNAYYIRYNGLIESKNNYFTGEYCYNYIESIEDSIQDWDGANQPSSSTSDQAFNKEDLIFDSLEMDFTLDRPQIDTTANDLIWNWVHRLLFTNTVIAGVTIALLTFGVIKLILGR